MSVHPDLPKDGVSRSPVAGPDTSEDGWIAIDLDTIPPQGSAEPAGGGAAVPEPKLPTARFGPLVPSETVVAGQSDPPDLEMHDAQDLGSPVAVARLHGWLERLRPSEPSFLSFERVREIEPEPPPQRRVPEADIIFIGRTKEPPGAGPGSSFDRARADAETPDRPASPEASNDDQPGPASRRRKLLLGLALLVAMTGALQALMRSTQSPAVPAVVDVLTF